jgi:hypothetical protein
MQKKAQTDLFVASQNSSALVEREHYKGIFYVRLSALPLDQKVRICAGPFRHAIIKILKDDILINDCMNYGDYVEWHLQSFIPANTFTQPGASLDPMVSTRERIHHA